MKTVLPTAIITVPYKVNTVQKKRTTATRESKAALSPELGQVDAVVVHEHGDRGESAVGQLLHVHGRPDGADEVHGVSDARLERDGRRPRQLARELLRLPRGLRLRASRCRMGGGGSVVAGVRRWRRFGAAGVGAPGGRGERRGVGRGGGDGEREAAGEEAREVVVHHGGLLAVEP